MAERSDRELAQLLALDAAAGPARPIDPARAASIITAALHGAGFPPPGAGSSGGGGGGAPGAGPARGGATATRAAGHAARRAPLAPKWTLLAGGAGAIAVAVAIGLVLRAPAAPAIDPAPLATAQPSRPLPASAPPDASRSAAAPPDGESLPRGPRAEPASPSPAAGAPTRRHAPPRSPTAAKPHTAPPRPPRPPPRTAAAVDPEDLLAEANAARRALDWRGADALYTRVASTGGTALAAQTALVASAQLHLEHLGDPEGAARRFRRALAAGARDALAEEARWGLAEAARASGDRAAERGALDEFLVHHAASVRAPQARARRASLEVPP